MRYPDWVLKHKMKGTTIKYQNGVYRIYRVHSERVKGKPYPVLKHDEYLGIITKEGLIPPKVKQVTVDDIEVREYGYSFVLITLCDSILGELKGIYNDMALTVLILALLNSSYLAKNSYLLDLIDKNADYPLKILRPIIDKVEDMLKSTIPLSELAELKTIYKVRLNKDWYISNLNNKHKEILKKLRIEVK